MRHSHSKFLAVFVGALAFSASIALFPESVFAGGIGAACDPSKGGSDCDGALICGADNKCAVDPQFDCDGKCTAGTTCNKVTGSCDSSDGGVQCGSIKCSPGQQCVNNTCTWTSGGGGDGGTGSGLVNPLNSITDLPSFLKAILTAIQTLGSIFLTLMLVFVGFKFVAAQGNAEELKSARTMLVWTVIGGLILLGATAIGEVIKSTVETL